MAPGKVGRTERIKLVAGEEGFDDRIQGPLNQNLLQQVGDFVLRRADACFSYQLAVVVDDAWQGVTDVVRGIDLLLSTPRQLYLQQALGLAQPAYAHIPLAVNQLGLKLSKQNLARAVDRQQPVPLLHRALLFLGQAVPAEARHWSCQALLDWAIANWQLERVPRQQQIVCETVDSLPKKMLDEHLPNE